MCSWCHIKRCIFRCPHMDMVHPSITCWWLNLIQWSTCELWCSSPVMLHWRWIILQLEYYLNYFNNGSFFLHIFLLVCNNCCQHPMSSMWKGNCYWYWHVSFLKLKVGRWISFWINLKSWSNYKKQFKANLNPLFTCQPNNVRVGSTCVHLVHQTTTTTSITTHYDQDLLNPMTPFLL